MLTLALASLAVAPAAPVQTWTEVTPSNSSSPLFVDLDVDPSDPQHIVAVDRTRGLFESFDSGDSWVFIPPPSLPMGTPDLPVSSAFDGNGQLYVGVTHYSWSGLPRPVCFRRQAGVFDPFGPSFSPWSLDLVFDAQIAVGTGESTVMALAITGNDGASVSSRLRGSTDGGASWVSWPLGAGSCSGLHVQEALDGTTVFARTRDFSSPVRSRVMRINPVSGTGVVIAGPPHEGRLNVGIGRARADTLIRGENDPGNLLPLQKSLDGGLSWAPFGTPGEYRAAARGNLNEDLLLRGVPSSPGSSLTNMEVSFDSGSTWARFNNLWLSTRYPQVVMGWDDQAAYVFENRRIFRLNTSREVGDVECNTSPNSTGVPARIALIGSESIADNDLRAWVSDAPPSTVGILLASTTPGFLPASGSRFGPICLGGSIGRGSFISVGAGPHGEFFFDAQLGGLPSPTGPVAAMAGETWRLQGWFRDNLGSVGSHTSDSIAVTFTP